jgi:hypothetical protein
MVAGHRHWTIKPVDWQVRKRWNFSQPTKFPARLIDRAAINRLLQTIITLNPQFSQAADRR